MTLPGKNYLSIVNIIIHTSKCLRLSTLNWQQVAVLNVSEGRSLTCLPNHIIKNVRNNCPQMFYRIAVLKNLQNSQKYT